MKAALIDNGSLEPAAHEGLRAAGRIPAAALGGAPAWTLAPWIRSQVSGGEREFVFIPFFVSPQGAIGSLLRRDLEALREEAGGFEFSFTTGLADGPALAEIVASRVRDAAE